MSAREMWRGHGTRLIRPDLSLEFLMGRALDNAMLNVGQKDTAVSTYTILEESTMDSTNAL